MTSHALRVTAVCLALMISVGSASTVRADLVTSLNTGYNNSTGTLLANGTLDAQYVIGPGGTGGHIGETPRVQTTPLPNTYVPAAASAASNWLVLPGTGLVNFSIGLGSYYFDTTVDLTGFNPATAQITGLRYAADNKLLGIFINGTAVFTQDSSFAEEFSSFRNLGNLGLGLFHSGTNSIRFDVYNDGFASITPMAFRVKGTVQAQALPGQPVSAVPEPGSLGLLAFGAASVLGWRSVRRRIA